MKEMTNPVITLQQSAAMNPSVPRGSPDPNDLRYSCELGD
jgi:hypothetical protein